MRKTEILKIKGDWRAVVDDCRATVKKPPLGKEPSKTFKKAILISEHSPIRDISVKFSWKNIKYCFNGRVYARTIYGYILCHKKH